MHPETPARCLAVLAIALFGCEPAAPAEPDAGPREDGGPAGCVLDRECQDDTYCNGEERCMPGATDADDRGCVAALAPPCRDGYECEEEERYCRTVCAVEADGDGDGRVAEACGGDDCDDADANRFPGNPEVCDGTGHDEDCNPTTFGFVDADGDGSGVDTCCNTASDGAMHCGDDCNDADSLINPRAGESCDRVDNNCDGRADETCPCMPGTAEVCGMAEGECLEGRRLCVEGILGECVGAVGPSDEICDTLDNDCDGEPDEHVLRTYYADADGDGYGIAATTLEACSAPDGWASNAVDCDDALPTRNPSSAETCNALDDDCDTRVDEGLERTYYLDADGDGFGADATLVIACTPPAPPPGSPPGARYVERGGDCDDTVRARSPVGLESCNAADDDCDGSVDETVLRTFHRDQDGDGVGGTTTTTGCTAPSEYVAIGGDCADMDPARYPGRFDSCNGVDDDCNGTIDPGCACTDGARTDCGAGPGGGPPTDVGECAIGSQICVGGAWGSCIGAVAPGTESCNGADDDCDGTTDEGTVVATCRADSDADGYGAGAAVPQCRDATRASAGYCPPGWTTTTGDCNDSNPAVQPGATELCNGIDDDCEGGVDEGTTVGGCYGDGDGDGYGIGSAVSTCRDGARAAQGFCAAGYTSTGGDCNDTTSAVRPMATETCNGRDDDCDGTLDDGAGMICALGSVRAGTGAFGACTAAPGFYTCNASCTSETFMPTPPAESCNGADDNCNGVVDDGFACARSSTANPCTTSCGTVGAYTCSATCTTGACRAATETCNGCDDDGDGTPDDGFACVRDATSSCTRSCGGVMVTGTRYCLGDCSGWSTCAAVEACNGCDDDLDGAVDETFTCERDRVYTCTTGCGTAGQRVCTSACTGYTAPSCRSSFEYCNYCDDDGDGTADDDRSLATGYSLLTPQCPDLSTASTITSCPPLAPFGQHTIQLVNNGASDAGAVWASPVRLGYDTARFNAEMVVSKSTSAILPADGWAMVLADGGSGTVGGVGGGLGVPMTRTGLAIEWRFYNTDPNVDQVDTIIVRRLTGSGSGVVLAGPVSVPSSRDFGNGDTTLTQNLIVYYTPDDPTTLGSEERLRVEVADVTLVTLTALGAGGSLITELSATSMITMGMTAATGGRVFAANARFGVDPIFGGADYSTTVELYGVCE